MGELMLFCVTPEVISVLDYRKGFGHTDLIKVPQHLANKGTLAD
jgi:hypothetical protein